MAASPSPHPPSLSSSRRGKRLLFPAVIGAASFLAGLVFSSTLQSRISAHPSFHHLRSNLTLLPSLQAAPLAANSSNADLPRLHTAAVGPTQLPLALAWYKAGYENPWQFSVQRTGIAELLNAYERVMDRDGKLPRVVVSFTSLPGRFAKHARSTLAIVKEQSFVPDRIYVAIPKASRRSKEDFQIPSWLANDPLVTVLRPEVDYGPATKLIPALLEEKRLGNENTRVVTVDDDNEGGWDPKALLDLVAYSLAFEDAAIGFTGWNATCIVKDARCTPEDSGVPHRQHRDRWYNFIKQADDYACHSLVDWLPDYYANCMGAVRKNYIAFADVIEGYRGALYQPRFFDLKQLTSILDKKKTPEYFFLCDDVWFSGWLAVKGVKKLIVNPAIHDNAPVREALLEHMEEKRKGKSMKLLPETEEDKKIGQRKIEVEDGLHSMGLDFANANHEAVRWFESKGAWTKGMWDRPVGFVYPSERREGRNKSGKGRRR